ncbi:MAG: transcription elongation factor subunit Spt4 [Desulfurococcaceae archaeon]
MPARGAYFKACAKCGALVEREAKQCPVCGSTSFVNEWEGVLIVLDAEKSYVAQALNVKRAGRYALKYT